MWGKKKPKPDTWSLREGDLPSIEHRALEPLFADLENNAYYRMILKELRGASLFVLKPALRLKFTAATVVSAFLICFLINVYLYTLYPQMNSDSGPGVGFAFMIWINIAMASARYRPFVTATGKKTEKMLGIRRDRMGDVLQTTLSPREIVAALWGTLDSEAYLTHHRTVSALGFTLSLAGSLLFWGMDRWFMVFCMITAGAGWALSRHMPYTATHTLTYTLDIQRKQMELKRYPLMYFSGFFKAMLQLIWIVALITLFVIGVSFIVRVVGFSLDTFRGWTADQAFAAFWFAGFLGGPAAGHVMGLLKKRRHAAAFEKAVKNVAQILEWTREDLFEKSSAKK